MSSTQFWVGALVPPLIKWANSYLKKFFNLSEFDVQTQKRIASKQYPGYFGILYGLWVIIILGSGVAGWGYDIKQQIITLFKIGFVYYIIVLPWILYLLIS